VDLTREDAAAHVIQQRSGDKPADKEQKESQYQGGPFFISY